jgi:hypothetical protein
MSVNMLIEIQTGFDYTAAECRSHVSTIMLAEHMPTGFDPGRKQLIPSSLSPNQEMMGVGRDRYMALARPPGSRCGRRPGMKLRAGAGLESGTPSACWRVP